MALPIAAILGAASLIGKIAGKGSSNRAGARVAEAGLNAQRDAQTLTRAQIEQNNARQNLLTDQNFRTGERSAAVRGSLLSGIEDFHVDRPDGIPSRAMTGGARPSAIADRKALGQQFEKDALARLLAESTLIRDTPALTPIPEAGKFDKFLNIIDLLGTGADVAGMAGLGKPKLSLPGTSNIKFTPKAFDFAPAGAPALDFDSLIAPAKRRPMFTPRTFAVGTP